jgi:hypothetical protein
MDSTLDPFADAPIPSLCSLCCVHFAGSISKTILDAFSATQIAQESQWDQTLELVRSVLDTINLFHHTFQSLYVTITSFRSNPSLGIGPIYIRLCTTSGKNARLIFFFFFKCSPKVEELSTQIPQKPFEDIVEHLLNTTAYEGLVVAALTSDKISSICTRFLSSNLLKTSVLATSLLVQRPCHLLHLELHGVIVTDDFVWSLASSASASILKTFCCEAKNLSHRSNKAWIIFTALETFRLLNSELPFTAELADVLSHLQMLETLQIQCGYWFPRYLTVLSALFAPHSLPSLRSVDIYCGQDMPSELFGQLYNLFLQRPTSHLLEFLEFYEDGPSPDHDFFIKMHTLCPNLTRPIPSVWDPSVPEKVSVAKNVKKDINPAFRFYDAEKISTLFPHLQSINLAYFNDPIPVSTRWDMFKSLETLELSVNSFVEITQYPPMLRKLHLSFKYAGVLVLPEGALERLLDAIFTQVPRLRSFKLLMGGNNLKAKHAELILKLLRHLENLSVGNAEYQKSSEGSKHVIQVAHPRLRHIPAFCITGVEVWPVWLPGVTRTNESTVERCGVFSPNISAIKLDVKEILEERNEMFERLSTSCRAAVLDVQGPRGSPWFAGIALLKNLTFLFLRDARQSILDDVLAEILPQLPLLSQLQATVTSGGRRGSCDWLRHSRLCDVWLMYNDGDDLDEVHLTKDLLPMLNTVDIRFRVPVVGRA